jgi:uncharacterized Zn finger protein
MKKRRSWQMDEDGFYPDADYFEEYEARRSKTKGEIARRQAGGEELHPVVPPDGMKLSTSFWGQAWNRNLESYADYEKRLPRGRSYFRQGRVYNLDFDGTAATALVAGQQVYEVRIDFKPLGDEAWEQLCERSAGQVHDVLDLLAGKLSPEMLRLVIDPEGGLFPSPREIKFGCTCPDWASLCKHVAATLYGIGATLDHTPEVLFLLRDCDPQALISTAEPTAPGEAPTLGQADLSALFGIDLAEEK